MSDYTTTTNLNLKKPAVGGSSDKWGEYLNSDLDTIDTEIQSLKTASTSRSLESLSNVLDLTPTTGQLLQFDTANWKAATVTIPEDIEDLGNVTVSSPADGQVLAYSASTSRWENQAPGAATIPDGTITTAKLSTSLQGQVNLILQTTGTPTDDQILRYNATTTNWEFQDLPGGTISALSDTDVSSVTSGNALMYNAAGDWEARDLVIADVTNLQTTLDTKLESSDLNSYVTSSSLTTTLGGYVTSTTLATELADYTETGSLALGTLNNVTNTSLAANDFLVYDAVDGAWENTTPTNARTALGLGTIATQDSDDVTITGGNITGIVDLAIADGGTGASSASAARSNLGLGTLATQSTITESQISDLGSYITASSTDTLTNKSGAISQWTNDSGYLTAETNDLTASVTWTNVPDANITQSSVTQHQAALTITESQISDLQNYLTAETNDLGSAVTGTLPIVNGGTGETTAAAARIALLPTLGAAGQVLAVNTGASDVEWVTPASGGGSGTVTSVAISGSDGIEVDSGSPITASGTIALGINAATLSSHLSLGTAATTAATDYATAAQGTLAASAVQPGDDANTLGSGAATDGYVLTADGAGNAAWEAVSGGGGGTATLVDANFIGSSSSDTSVSGYKIYAYQTGNGTASYAIKVPSVIDDVDILIVGAGGGTTGYSGGGGGGGVIHLDGITLTPNVYYITVGSGSANSAGGDSIFQTYDGSVVSYTAKGGGNGVSSSTGVSGGSGAGGGSADTSNAGGSETQSSQSHSELPFGSITQYGSAGGSNNTGSPYATGGGGGAGGAGQNAQSASVSGNGGAGIDLSAHFGTAFGVSGVFAGGGGGMARAGGTAGSGGSGGGGAGGTGTSTAGTAGTNYTGGGAGGNYESGGNLAGGHGIILIRVPV